MSPGDPHICVGRAWLIHSDNAAINLSNCVSFYKYQWRQILHHLPRQISLSRLDNIYSEIRYYFLFGMIEDANGQLGDRCFVFVKLSDYNEAGLLVPDILLFYRLSINYSFTFGIH